MKKLAGHRCGRERIADRAGAVLAPALAATTQREQGVAAAVAAERPPGRRLHARGRRSATRRRARPPRHQLNTGFRFTPAAASPERSRAVRVAIRARAATPAEAARTRRRRARPRRSPRSRRAPTISASRVGWRRFALSGDVAQAEGGVVPGSREAAEVGISYRANRRLTGRVAVGAERAEGAQRAHRRTTRPIRSTSAAPSRSPATSMSPAASATRSQRDRLEPLRATSAATARPSMSAPPSASKRLDAPGVDPCPAISAERCELARRCSAFMPPSAITGSRVCRASRRSARGPSGSRARVAAGGDRPATGRARSAPARSAARISARSWTGALRRPAPAPAAVAAVGAPARAPARPGPASSSSSRRRRAACAPARTGRAARLAAGCNGGRRRPRPRGSRSSAGQQAVALPLVGHQPEARQRLAAAHGASYSSRHERRITANGSRRSATGSPRAARLAGAAGRRGDPDRRLQDPAAPRRSSR